MLLRLDPTLNKAADKINSFIGKLTDKYSERTIARDLAFRLVIALSTCLLLAGLISFAYQTRSERDELRERLGVGTRNFATLLALPVWTYNEVEIKALVGSHGHADEITAVRVLDDRGATIAEYRKQGKSVDLSQTRTITYKGRKIGKVIVSASTTPLYVRAWQNLAWTFILILLSITIVILLIMPLLERFLEAPLSKLVNGIQRIASGQFREKLPAFQTNELRRISEEVNFMADKIALREQQIVESMQSATMIKTELQIAETIQKSMIATRGFNTARRVAQYYQPMENLSGDWMTVFECDKGRTIYALIGDVTGHGIPQGLVTMAAFGAIQTLRPLIQQNSRSFTPATILNTLRGALVTILHECELAMTTSVLKIDVATRKISMSSAGHPFPLIVRSASNSAIVKSLTAEAQSPFGFEFLSRSATPSPYQDIIFDLYDDDIVCLFSDGLIEARGKNNRTFQRSFLSLLRSMDRRYPPSVLLDRILQNLECHMKGTRLSDDICLMVIDTRKDDIHEAVA